MANYIIIALLAIIIGGSAAYVYRARKRDAVCIGCSCSGQCGSACSGAGAGDSCGGCSCGSLSVPEVLDDTQKRR